MKRTAKYVGLDVHQATTVISVRDTSGRVIARDIVATDEASLIGFLGRMRGPGQVAPEEGTQAQWLHDLLEPVADRVVVCDRRGKSKTGNKGDQPGTKVYGLRTASSGSPGSPQAGHAFGPRSSAPNSISSRSCVPRPRPAWCVRPRAMPAGTSSIPCLSSGPYASHS
jgi:hypothetical protein